MTNIQISIPTISGLPFKIDARTSSTMIFAGSNGSGKTRLGVWLDNNLNSPEIRTHRISAHRAITFRDDITLGSLESANDRLIYGGDGSNKSAREVLRWRQKPATYLLDDYELLLQALYAEQNDLAVTHLETHKLNPSAKPPTSKLEKLKSVWESLLPHRKLKLGSASIKIFPTGINGGYNASELSDGERVIFYLLGQALLALPNSVLIIDEPELHIHKSLLSRLWDEIENARDDLLIVLFTHDLEFAASRPATQKYIVSKYTADQNGKDEKWEIEAVADTHDFPEELYIKILGSRKNILFAEGETESLDNLIYRHVYDEHYVVPVGNHDAVLHAVASFTRNRQLHRIGCCGIIDRDDISTESVDLGLPIFLTKVAEIENLLLMPSVFYSIARKLDFDRKSARAKTEQLKFIIFHQATKNKEGFALRYCQRKLDRTLKQVTVKRTTIADLENQFQLAISGISAREFYDFAIREIEGAIDRKDIYRILAIYDDKALLSEAAKLLNYNRKSLEEHLGRMLGKSSKNPVLRTMKQHSPRLR